MIVGAGSAGCVLGEPAYRRWHAQRARCSNTAAPTARSSCRCLRHSRFRWAWRSTTGATTRSRSLASADAACTRPAAKCSADRRRSTGSCTCAAMHRTSSAGKPRARRAGTMRPCCRTSAAPKRAPKAATSIAAIRAAADALRHALTNPLHAAWLAAGEAGRLSARPATSTASSRKASGAST